MSEGAGRMAKGKKDGTPEGCAVLFCYEGQRMSVT